MSILRHSSSLVLLCLLLACGTEPNDGLVGYWKWGPEQSQPAGSYEIWLSFNSFGMFEQQVRSYGAYPGQDPSQLSSYNKIKGSYRTEGDRLKLDPQRQAWWDPTFYGPDEQEADAKYSQYYDEARFTLDGDRLVLNYLSYPFDAPVPTTAEFVRAR